jgi:hypothetical protein
MTPPPPRRRPPPRTDAVVRAVLPAGTPVKGLPGDVARCRLGLAPCRIRGRVGLTAWVAWVGLERWGECSTRMEKVSPAGVGARPGKSLRPRPSSTIEPGGGTDQDTLAPPETSDRPTPDPRTPPGHTHTLDTRTRTPSETPTDQTYRPTQPSQQTGQSRHPLSASGPARERAGADPCKNRGVSGVRSLPLGCAHAPQRSPQPRGAFTPSVWRKEGALPPRARTASPRCWPAPTTASPSSVEHSPQ